MADVCVAAVAAAAPSPAAVNCSFTSSFRVSCRHELRTRTRPARNSAGGRARCSRNPAEPDTERTPQNDSSYLWTLGLGSVGGAAAIKYGSILLPDITRPNIVQALLMVSLPVAAAILILLKLSSKED